MSNNSTANQSSSIAQQGFTLIELMISLVLGLLISAAVIQVFITSQRVDRIQTAGSDIQDKAVFGLQAIEPQIRLANLGNAGIAINDTTALGGVVLTSSKDANATVNLITKDDLGVGYLTRSEDMDASGSGDDKWNGTLSNTDVKSDQLTIQYINRTGRPLFDCEGAEIPVDARVISRYFVTEGSAVPTGSARKNLNLNCDAGRIASDGTVSGFTDAGQTIIENIDQFNIRLGIQRSLVVGGVTTAQYADMTVKDYMALGAGKPPITNIKLAILARSTANSPETSAETFGILGTTQTLKAQTNAPKYLRRVYESNILLRNARVMRVIDNATGASVVTGG